MKAYTELAHPVGTGCYVDGHHGWRCTAAMITAFAGVAYDLDDDDLALLARYEDGEDEALDDVPFLADDCEDALNSLLPPNMIAHWYDGEFFVSPYCEDGECDDETCYCHCD